MKFDLGWYPVIIDLHNRYVWLGDAFDHKSPAQALGIEDYPRDFIDVVHLSFVDGRVIDDTEEYEKGPS